MGELWETLICSWLIKHKGDLGLWLASEVGWSCGTESSTNSRWLCQNLVESVDTQLVSGELVCVCVGKTPMYLGLE